MSNYSVEQDDEGRVTAEEIDAEGRAVAEAIEQDLVKRYQAGDAVRGTAGERTPEHYRGSGGLQPFDVIDAYGLDFYSGNLLKYLLRYKSTGNATDLDKARHYLDEFVKRELGESS